MEVFLIRLLQFILALSLLVLLHEGGHCFFAKLFGVRVEKFYIFFDPWFHLFEFKPKNSETAYGIGWLPLGGYCKIAGMIDESFDTAQMAKPAQKWEFRSRPAWQRLLIMVGGVLVNFLLALLIYSMCLFHWGEEYIDVKDMTMGMSFNNAAKELGFEDGDVLLATDKGPLTKFDADLYRDLSTATRVDILRHGEPLSLTLPGDINLLDMLKASPTFVVPYVPVAVDSVLAGTEAERMGLEKGDIITALDGRAIASNSDFETAMGRHRDMIALAQTAQDSLAARTVTLSFLHAARTEPGDTVTRQALLGDDLLFGFQFKWLGSYYKSTKIEYGFFESFPAGVSYGCRVLAGYVGDLKYIFSSDGAKSLGGFGTLGSLFPPTWDWHTFWLMTAFLSIILAFMNILPIPALDGGHVLFLLYEMITRRKPGEKFMIIAEYIGVGLLLLLMIVANLNDILRWLGYM